MDTEAQLRAAERLAAELSRPITMRGRYGPEPKQMDDNEVKKAFGVLCRSRSLAELHAVIGRLATTAFASRSGQTRAYYLRLQETIPWQLPVTMDVDDAIAVLGWAVRLMKYEELRNPRPHPTPQRAREPDRPGGGQQPGGGRQRPGSGGHRPGGRR